MPPVNGLHDVMTDLVDTAVIGPPEHVNRLITLAESIPELRTSEFAYDDEQDASSLFREAARTNAVAVFTGPKPFHVAQAEVGPLIPMVYVPFTGAALYRAVFLHGRSSGQDYRMSIDTVTERDVKVVLNDLGLTDASFSVLPYEPDLARDDFIRFHTDAYAAGFVAGALTTLQSAYDALRADGVPVIRVEPATSSMVTTLRSAGLMGRATEANKHELVVGIFTHGPEEDRVNNLRKRIHEFVDDIDGMVANQSERNVVFFGSRGLLEQVTVNYTHFPILASADVLGTRLQLGVGLGQTVNQAHAHAVAALAQANEHSGNVAFVVSSARKLLGPAGDGGAAHYRVQVSDPDRLALARKVGAGPVMLERFGDALARWDRETFTANDLAHLLHRDIRTVRRLLAKLRSAGVIEVVGKAQLHGRGKPRQVFRLHPDHRELVREPIRVSRPVAHHVASPADREPQLEVDKQKPTASRKEAHVNPLDS